MTTATLTRRAIFNGQDIKTIADIEAIEQQDSMIFANTYDRYRFDFGAWRKSGVAPVSRQDVLDACLCSF